MESRRTVNVKMLLVIALVAVAGYFVYTRYIRG